MKEVIVVNYTGRKGGGELDAYEVTKAFIKQGENVIAIISDQIENISMWKQLSIERLIIIQTYRDKFTFVVNSILFPVKVAKKIKRECSEYQIKAVYCPMSSFWARPINRIFKGSKLVSNHDPIPHSGTNRIAVWLMERSYTTADIIIVHSESFLDFARKKYGEVFYIALGRHDLYKSMNKKKKIVCYDPDKINFLFFGRITEYKGVDILLKAYQRIEERYPEATLYIIGDGDISPYRDLIKGLKSITVINRWIRDEEVESCFLGNSLITICPYKDATQSGVILLSYDYKVPVIASDTGGIREQVINNETGLLIHPEDIDSLYNAMQSFIENEKLISHMKKKIEIFLQRFSWEKAASRLIELMEE